MNQLLTLFATSISFLAYSQPNCNVFLWNGDTLQYRACKLVEENDEQYYQFAPEFQALMQEAVAICPYFAYPYYEISAPYIKSGNFIVWKEYMDKAVQYAPRDYLPLRASLRYKFFADFEGTLQDLTILDTLMIGDIGYSHDGKYHLNIVRGLCLKEMGKKAEAIAVMEEQLATKTPIGVYDYLHLGVLYLETGAIEQAISNLEKQVTENDIAECSFYLALCYKKQNEEKKYINHLAKAKQQYMNSQCMSDPYNALFDKIYLTDIEVELSTIKE